MCNGRWRQYRCHADAAQYHHALYQIFLPVPPCPAPHFPASSSTTMPCSSCPAAHTSNRPAPDFPTFHAFFAATYLHCSSSPQHIHATETNHSRFPPTLARFSRACSFREHTPQETPKATPPHTSANSQDTSLTAPRYP